jgi:hypothetical protein
LFEPKLIKLNFLTLLFQTKHQTTSNHNMAQELAQEIARLRSQLAQLERRERREQVEQLEQLEQLEVQIDPPATFTVKDKKQLQKQLGEKIAFFHPNNNPTIFEDLENPERTNKLVAGMIQSGKSNVICGLAMYCAQALGVSVIILLRNYTADYEQLRSKLEKEYDVIPFYAGDKTQLKHMFRGETKIMICLENEKQMTRLDAEILRTGSRFCLIADEVDAVCYKADETRQRITVFESLKSKALQFIGVTATSYAMLYKEQALVNHAIYRVPIDPDYKGIDYLIRSNSIEELPNQFDFKLKAATPAIWELSSDMEHFYTQILDTPAFDKQPVIALQTTETEIKKQFQCMAALARHPIFKKEFSIVVYNGEGIYLYSAQRLDNEIEGDEGEMSEGVVPNDRFSHYIQDCNVLHFKKAGIKHALQYFKNRARPPTHILIIAGLMVGRGLNIVSSDYQWHVSHQILRVSDTADVADLIQKLRLLGVFRDSTPLKLFLTKKESENLKRGHLLHNTLLDGAQRQRTQVIMPVLVEQIPISKDHIPIRRTTKKCPEPNWNEQEEEKKEMEMNTQCKYYCILPQELGPREKEVYDYAVDYLQDKKGSWVLRNTVVRHIMTFNFSENPTRGRFSGMCTVISKHHRTESEEYPGLLFLFKRNRWYMRLN